MPSSMPTQARMVVVIRAKHGYEYYFCVNWITSDYFCVNWMDSTK